MMRLVKQLAGIKSHCAAGSPSANSVSPSSQVGLVKRACLVQKATDVVKVDV
jgi:hypothetical protein